MRTFLIALAVIVTTAASANRAKHTDGASASNKSGASKRKTTAPPKAARKRVTRKRSATTSKKAVAKQAKRKRKWSKKKRWTRPRKKKFVPPKNEKADADPPPPPGTPKHQVTVAFTGDIMFGRYIEGGFDRIGNGKRRLFKHVAPLLKSDFTLVNLETPVQKKPLKKSPYGNHLRFVARPSDLDLLIQDGVHGVTIANNHSYDMRNQGARETPKRLREKKLMIVGESFYSAPVVRPTYVTRKGWRIAYIGVTTVRNGPQRKSAPVLPYAFPGKLAPLIKSAVATARKNADFVVVVVHWGYEYRNVPPKPIRDAAKAIAKLGVDLIVGHHPHVLQGVGKIGNTPVVYSLGNFLFDNTTIPLRYGGVLKWQIAKDGCRRKLVFHPTHYQRHKAKLYLRPATGKTAARIAKRLHRLSKKLGVVWNIENTKKLHYSYNACNPKATAAVK